MNSATTSSATFEALGNFLDNHPSVKFLRLLWVDLSSTVRARVLTVQHVRCLLLQRRFPTVGGNLLQIVDNAAPMNMGRTAWSVGQCALMPDAGSLRLWPGSTTHAVAFCYFSAPIPTTAPSSDIAHHSLCPRGALHRTLQRLDGLGLRLMVGFEVEFVCRAGVDTSTERSVHQVSGLRCLETPVLPALCEIANSLSSSNIAVQQIYAEGGASQFELATGPTSPMEALDALVLARETIVNTCRRRAISVSFHPRSDDGLGGVAFNGVHLNLSFHGDAAGDEQHEQAVEHFIVGVFDHLDSLFAIGLPHPECYLRVGPERQAIGSYKAWGSQNRTVPVRKKSPDLWEFRFLDSSTNAFLLLAALAAAGIDGMQRKAPLRLLDCTGKIAWEPGLCSSTRQHVILTAKHS